VVNWRQFGSSGHVKAPLGLVLESFTACAPHLNEHIKTLGFMPHVASAYAHNTHQLVYKRDFYAVNSKLQRVDAHASALEQRADDVLVINHYLVRSKEEFDYKVRRGHGMGGKPPDFFEVVEREATSNCTYAVPLGARVRKRLAMVGAGTV